MVSIPPKFELIIHMKPNTTSLSFLYPVPPKHSFLSSLASGIAGDLINLKSSRDTVLCLTLLFAFEKSTKGGGMLYTKDLTLGDFILGVVLRKEMV